MQKSRHKFTSYFLVVTLAATAYWASACRQGEGGEDQPAISPSPVVDIPQTAESTPDDSLALLPTEPPTPTTDALSHIVSFVDDFPTDCHFDSLSIGNEWVACSGDGLWVHRIGEEGWTQVTTEGEDLFLAAWSPDGAALAVTGWREPIWLYETGSWHERAMIYDNNGGHHGGVSWSSDGRYLITFPPMGSLILIRADGSGAEQLLEEGTIGNPMFGAVKWSPDGREIIYWSNPDTDYLDRPPTDFELWSIDIETREQRFLYGPALRAGENDPIWSSDGQQIAFLLSPGEEGTFGVAILNLATMDTRIIELQEELLYVRSGMAWSPDDSHIAMVASPYEGVCREPDIWVLSVETGEARQYTDTRRWRRIIRWNQEGIVTLTSHELFTHVLELIVVDQ